MRKLLFFAMVCGAALCLAGCGDNAADENAAGADNPAVGEQHTPGSDSVSEQTGGGRRADVFALRMLLPYDGPFTDPLADMVMDMLKIDIEPVVYPVEAASYEEALETLLAANDAPDVWRAPLKPARFAGWVNSGVIRGIPDDVLEQCPALSDIINADAVAAAYRELYGSVYYAPVVNDRSLAYQTDGLRIFYRKDLAAAVPAPVPLNTDEFYDFVAALARKMAEEEAPETPDGGPSEPASRHGLAVYDVSALACMYGFEMEGWVLDEGRYVPAYYSDRIMEPLIYARRLWDEGLLKITGWNAGDNLTNCPVIIDYGHVGAAFERMLEPIVNAFDVTPEEAFDRYAGIMDIPNAEGREAVWRYEPPVEGWFLRAGLNADFVASALRLFEFSLSDDAVAYARYGQPGVTYASTARGFFLLTDPETNRAYNLSALYPTGGLLGLNTRDYAHDADLYTPPVSGADVPAAYRLLCPAPDAYYRPSVTVTDALCRVVDSPARDALVAGVDNRLNGVITGGEPLDEAFARFREQCAELGVEDVITEVNAALNRLQ